MKKPVVCFNESEIIDTPGEFASSGALPQQDFNDVTKLASQICATPFAAVSLFNSNRKFFKLHQGLQNIEIPTEDSFCIHAINAQQNIFIIPDAKKDELFCNNPYVTGEPGIVFYASIPLVLNDGFALGTLCVTDKKPRTLSKAQLDALQTLANQTIRIIEQSRKKNLVDEKQKELTRYVHMFEQTGKIALVGGWRLDVINQKLDWSGATKSIHEVPDNFEPVLEEAINFYKEGESRDTITKLVSEAIETGKPFEAELQIITAKGNHKWVKTKGEAVFNNGKCEQIFGVFQDINYGKLKDLLLEENQAALQSTLDQLEQTNKIAKTGGWTLDLVSRKRTLSSVTKEILEIEDDYNTNIDEPLNIYKDEVTKQRISKLVSDAMNNGLPFNTEFLMITAKGNERWVRTKGKAEFENGKCIRLHGLFQDITEEKRKDILLEEKSRQLEESKMLLEQTSEISKIGGWNVDLVNDKITWTNVTRLIHEINDDFNLNIETGINFYKRGENRNKIKELVTLALQREMCYDVELQITTAKGNERWVRTKGTSVFENGKCVRLYGTIQDIHAEKLKDLKIAEDENIFRLTIENSPIGMALVAPSGKWIKVNKTLCQMVGYSENELLQIDFQKITHWDDLEKDLNLVHELLENKIQSYELEKRYIHKKGFIVDVLISVSLVRDEYNEPLYFVSHIMDISERKRTEQAITQERQLLLTLVNNIPLNIFIKDKNFKKILVNKKELEYLGFKNEEDVIGKDDFELYPTESAVLSLAEDQQIFATGKPLIDKETFNIKKDRSTNWFLTSKIPLRNNYGELTGILGISYDINERKKSEEKQKALLDVTTEQNTRLVNFAHIVSHNLKSVSANFTMLLNEYIDETNEDERAAILQLLKKSSDNLTETVTNLNEIVDINNKVNQSFSSTCLSDAIEKVKHNVQSMLKKNEISFINEVPQNIKICAVPAYLDSILLNFITNSIKYKSPDRNAYIKFTATEQCERVLFIVEDNGKGIDLKKHGANLFGMYKTFHGNKDAKGVGLFITKNQIEAMAGSIDVESKVNEGTKFKICFNKK